VITLLHICGWVCRWNNF